MNHRWRLYLYLRVTSGSSPRLLSPSRLRPPRFPAHSSLHVANKLHELTRASGRFLSPVPRSSLRQPAQSSTPSPGNILLSGFHNIALTWLWSSLLALFSVLCRFLCWLLSVLYLRVQYWIPLSFSVFSSLGDFLQTCASLYISSVWWWLPNLFSPAEN